MNGFAPLAKAMYLGFRRDGMALFFSILFPLMFLVIFASVLGGGSSSRSKIVEVGPVPVVDAALAASPTLRDVLEVRRSTDLPKALEDVRKGDVDAAVVQRGDRLVVHYSRADQIRAATVQGVLGSVVDRANLAGVPQRFQVTASPVDDESLKPVQFLTPGMLGWALSSAAMFTAAQTLVTWRTKGILRRLRLSPVPIRNVFLARLTVSLGIALVQTAVFLGVAVAFYGLKLTGAWWMCVPVVLAGVTAFLALGMLIGSAAKTQESAQAAIQVVVFPMVFLGGSFFPLESAPAWLQTVSRVIPLRYLNEGMLDVLGRGQGPGAVVPDILVLLGVALVAAIAASRLFRWDDA